MAVRCRSVNGKDRARLLLEMTARPIKIVGSLFMVRKKGKSYLAFAIIAAVGIPIAPSAGSATTEWLRMFSILVTYALAFLAASSAAGSARLLVAIVLSALVPAIVGIW